MRPIIAILALNQGTEVTDFMIPNGVLRQSGLADVIAVAPEAKPITLYPAAVAIKPEATTSQFDARYQDGADYVVAPAMQPRDDAKVLAWVKSQAAKGATIVGICNGSKTLAAAGLLDGRAATAHWNDIKGLVKIIRPCAGPAIDAMFVHCGVATSTGVSA